MPIPESLENHYGVDPEAYWHHDYFSHEETYFSEQIKRFKALFRGSPNVRALDVGAGVGKCLAALTKAGFDAFGIEGSPSFHRMAIERSGLPPDRIIRASVEEASFEPASFEFVTFGAVLEHLYDPSLAINNALRWLTPDGLIYIEVPSAKWLITRLGNLFYALSGTDYVTNLSPMHPPYHLYEFSLETFKRHSQRFHYEIAHHEFYVAQTYLPRAVSPLMSWVMNATNTGMQLEVWLRKADIERAS